MGEIDAMLKLTVSETQVVPELCTTGFYFVERQIMDSLFCFLTTRFEWLLWTL